MLHQGRRRQQKKQETEGTRNHPAGAVQLKVDQADAHRHADESMIWCELSEPLQQMLGEVRSMGKQKRGD